MTYYLIVILFSILVSGLFNVFLLLLEGEYKVAGWAFLVSMASLGIGLLLI